MGGNVERVLLIGLDCAAPRFVFGPDAFDLPNMQALAQRGAWGDLESCHPPITVPAWASMTSGRDPGALGVYGFRNRKDHSYDDMVIANGASIKIPRVWDILSRNGKKVVVLGVPQTYPVRPVNGWLVSGFLTPDAGVHYTYPKSLKPELESEIGEFIFDVKDFRTDDKARLLAQLHTLLDNRFAAAQYLLKSKPWDFFMMVEMGVDRIHHGLWRECVAEHPEHEPGNPYCNAIREYYEAVDQHIGALLAEVGEETAVMVVSDHGAKSMYGGICVNQWLVNEGLLVLHETPDQPTRLEDCKVDWSRTTAWSSGGYYARVFLNVKGREPQGIIEPADCEQVRVDIAARLEAIPDPEGNPIGTRAHTPESLYLTIEGVAPDLIVYFGDLHWRSVGTVPYDSVYTFENDTGPDDANHDYQGIAIVDDRTGRNGQHLQGAQLMDVAPTVLNLLGVDVPEDMQGRSSALGVPS
jgi:predicted AlkP superfamily phosphohydrolase/phosphomutase